MEQVDLSYVIPIAILIGLAFAGLLTRDVLRRETGNDKMREIAQAIREGARAFLRRQYKTIAMIAAVLAVIFAVALGLQGGWDLGLKTAGAFALGASFSALSGYIGMQIAIRSNVRSAAGSLKSFNDALVIALRGGAVSGLAIVSMSLAGVALLYYGYGGASAATGEIQDQVVLSIVGFGFGASLVALFAQLGGGIYTKAADVGADLVGKVEAGIPEDDPRNPAVIADLVGDNVGDCAGRGADLFESTAAENIGAMILGVVLFPYFGIAGILFPLVARAFGILASIVGVLIVRAKEDEAPMSALNRGYIVTTVLAALLFGFAAWAMLQPSQATSAGDATWIYYWICGITGMITAILYVWITQYYTEARYRPVAEIAKSSETGPATNIISGFSVGLEATAIPAVTVSIALLVSYWLGETTGIPGGGIYGTAIATMGMLATAAYILAMDTFGPIVDNGAGIVEMAGMSKEARKNMDKLDAAGNTTKALTKGYAVGSAALAAFLLFNAFLREAKVDQVGNVRRGVHGRGPRVPVQRLCDPGGRPRGLVHHQGRPGPVPREPRDYGGFIEAGLRAHGGHLHPRGAPGDDRARGPRGRYSRGRRRRVPVRQDHRGHLCGRTSWRDAHGRDHRGHPHGAGLQHGRRRVGQREEVHRGRELWRERRDAPQGRGRRRHGRRPVQGHRGTVPAHPREAPVHDHPGHGPAPNLRARESQRPK